MIARGCGHQRQYEPTTPSSRKRSTAMSLNTSLGTFLEQNVVLARFLDLVHQTVGEGDSII